MKITYIYIEREREREREREPGTSFAYEKNAHGPDKSSILTKLKLIPYPRFEKIT